jgi:large subunit ribosomal protein L6
MSRIGKQPVTLPLGVTIEPQLREYIVKGSKGTLTVPRFEGVVLTVEAGKAATFTCEKDENRALWGLSRSLLQNAVIGVSTGWTKTMELHGVGMRAALQGTTLNLSLGFSHPVVVEPPAGITFSVEKNTVTVSGIDRQLVGEIAAQIRKRRKPEPYKGKGIRYAGEYVRRKAGKTGGKGKK